MTVTAEATSLVAVYDDWDRTVLVPAAEVTEDTDRPYRGRPLLSRASSLADRYEHGCGPEPKSWERAR